MARSSDGVRMGPVETAQMAVIAVCIAFGLAVAVLVVTSSTTVYDEAGYAYQGWAMLVHGWQPFVDFHMKVLPLVHVMYGLPQALLGPEMLLARYTATFYTAITLLIACLVARRLAGNWAAILVLAVFVFNLEAAVRYYRSLAIAPTALFFVLALYWLTMAKARPWQDYAASLAVAGMVMCRHDMLASAMVLWGYLWLDRRRSRPAMAWGSVAVGILAVAAVGVRYYLLAPAHFSAIMFGGLVDPGAVVGGPYAPGGTPLSATEAAWHLMMMLRAYMAPMLLMAPAIGLLLWRGMTDRSGFRATCHRHRALIVVVVAAAANYVAHLVAIAFLAFPSQYMLDFYIFLPVTIAAAASFVLAARSLPSPAAAAQYTAFAVVIMAAPVWAQGIPSQFDQDADHMAEIRTGAEAISRIVPAHEYVFSLDDPHQFLQAGRLMHPMLTYQLFHFTDSDDTEALVARTHHYNKAILESLLDQSRYAVISDDLVDWMVHSGRYESGEALRDFIFERLESKFRLVETVPGSYAGPTRIYQRRR